MNGKGQFGILVVDDEPSVRLLVTRMLEQQGYAVQTAEDGQEAAELFHTQAERIGLVVTDWAMPRKNGMELARELRGLKPELPVIIMSGNFRHEQTKMDGMVCIAKPFLIQTLLHEVEKYFKTEDCTRACESP